VFRVLGDALVRGQVLSSGGQFPVSIAVHGNQVFVLNALGGASVAGFIQSGGRLVPQPSWQRDLGVGTTSATVFTATPGQIGFTPGGSHLVVTTKGAANTVEVFQDGPSADPAASSDGQYPCVQAGGPGNIDAYRINPDGSLTRTASVTVPGAAGGEGIIAQ